MTQDQDELTERELIVFELSKVRASIDALLALLGGWEPEPDPDKPDPPDPPEPGLPEDQMAVHAYGAHPLRRVAKYNKSGWPVMGIYPKAGDPKRIVPHLNQEIIVLRGEVKCDGGKKNTAFQVVAGQKLGGDIVPVSPDLFIFLRHTVEYQEDYA